MNQKPHWRHAPDWAKFLAMDKDGYWFWYEFKPRLTPNDHLPFQGRIEMAKTSAVDWSETLEARP